MTGFAPTDEQLGAQVLFDRGGSFAIEAGAGAGKTSTLRMLAASAPSRRGQYVAFNRAIVAEAAVTMPGTVNCATAHSLAFRAQGRRFGERLRGSRRLRSDQLARILELQTIVVQTDAGRKPLLGGFLAGLVLRGVTRFCQSGDPEIEGRHLPYVPGLDLPVPSPIPGEPMRRGYANNDLLRHELEPAMKAAWADLCDPAGRLPYRHDHYLKLWQLTDPRIAADYILFDEAQDANPVMVAIVAAQAHAQLVFVGDSQQQIYTFTGAVNALESVPATDRCYLTRSFRFGPPIAELANRILEDLPTPLRITGSPDVASTLGPVPSPDAVLTRTNATAVRRVIVSQAAGIRAHLLGGGQDVAGFARAAGVLQEGGLTDHPELACFSTWGEVQAYVEQDQQGDELRLLVSLVDEFGVAVILEALDRLAPEGDCEVVVSTAHKAKGREWPAVQLTGDFVTDEGKLDDEDLRLLYVAVTRARRELDVTSLPLLDDAPPRTDEVVLWTCATCGPHPGNRFDWCAIGCGSDYRQMVRD